jgi:glycosyltransferase involved in cell wall biosynthesis
MQRLARARALIRRLGIRDAVRLRLGYVPMREVGTYFCAADLVLLPHVRGSVSGVLLAAYGYGRPVVATAVGGMPELVEEGRTGALVPPGSAEALADAITRSLECPERLAEMGALARERARRLHAWPDVARRTAAVYESIPGMTASTPLPSAVRGTAVADDARRQ